MMLTLPIKKKWFDMILSGEKKEEYREKNRYYRGRFRMYLGLYRCSPEEKWKKRKAVVRFRNGYAASSPSFTAVCTIDIGPGREEWGAEPGKEYYRLQILEIREE